MDKADIIFQKIARLGIDEVEDTLGVYLNDKTELQARDLINSQYAQSFALRHPVLTGIPTLGIAPAISYGRAMNKITRTLLKTNPELRAEVKQNELEYEQQEREDLEAIRRHREKMQATAVAKTLGATAAGLGTIWQQTRGANG